MADCQGAYFKPPRSAWPPQQIVPSDSVEAFAYGRRCCTIDASQKISTQDARFVFLYDPVSRACSRRYCRVHGARFPFGLHCHSASTIYPLGRRRAPMPSSDPQPVPRGFKGESYMDRRPLSDAYNHRKSVYGTSMFRCRRTRSLLIYSFMLHALELWEPRLCLRYAPAQ